MSPYLRPYRLQDVISALQIMGSAKNYKRSAEKWAKVIDNEPASAESWDAVFKEHPEFFRESGKGKICIMWRKGLPHDPATDERKPLDSSEIMALMDTAIRLYEASVEVQRNKEARQYAEEKWERESALSKTRWMQQIWISVVTAILAFSSAILAAWIKINPN